MAYQQALVALALVLGSAVAVLGSVRPLVIPYRGHSWAHRPHSHPFPHKHSVTIHGLTHKEHLLEAIDHIIDAGHLKRDDLMGLVMHTAPQMTPSTFPIGPPPVRPGPSYSVVPPDSPQLEKIKRTLHIIERLFNKVNSRPHPSQTTHELIKEIKELIELLERDVAEVSTHKPEQEMIVLPPIEEKPIVEPVVEPFVEPIVEPVVEPIVKPIEEPIVEPMVETVEPTMEPIVEPIVEPVVEPVVEPIMEPIVEPIVEPIIEPIVEPMPHPEPMIVPEPSIAEPEQPPHPIVILPEEVPEHVVEEIHPVEPAPAPEPEPEPVVIVEPVPEEPRPEPIPEPEPAEVVAPVAEVVTPPEKPSTENALQQLLAQLTASVNEIVNVINQGAAKAPSEAS